MVDHYYRLFKIHSRYRYKSIVIWVTYLFKIAVVHLNKHQQIARATIAAKLFKLAGKVSPDFVKTYDRFVIERYYSEDI